MTKLYLRGLFFACIFAITQTFFTPISIAAPIEKPFKLETYFAGKMFARGVFESKIAGIRRTFSVYTRGKWNGKVFTLVEDFVYDDGEKGRKTWRFTKLAEGKYQGTREDVVGLADVYQEGDAIKLKYTIDVPNKDGSVTRVDFDDTIKRIDNNNAVNTALVYKYFLPVAGVRVDFVRKSR
jgi:Protein of unknown function (DUF3833)